MEVNFPKIPISFPNLGEYFLNSLNNYITGRYLKVL